MRYNYPRHITYKCGHSADVVLSAYNEMDAGRQAGNLRQVLCSECSERKARRREELRTEAERLGFPHIAGTPAQVPWAMEIRSRVYRFLSRRDGEAAAREFCSVSRSAKWWIDQRKMTDKTGD